MSYQQLFSDITHPKDYFMISYLFSIVALFVLSACPTDTTDDSPWPLNGTSTQITDAGLKNLKGLTRLTSLHLENPRKITSFWDEGDPFSTGRKSRTQDWCI